MPSLLFLLALLVSLPPGVVRPLSLQAVCSTRWGLDHRHITEAMKRVVATRDGIPRGQIVGRGKGPCCEFDHLIPRELGGADDVRNLWAQPWAEAIIKDREENRLHAAVCKGSVSLAAAQDRMRHWR